MRRKRALSQLCRLLRMKSGRRTQQDPRRWAGNGLQPGAQGAEARISKQIRGKESDFTSNCRHKNLTTRNISCQFN